MKSIKETLNSRKWRPPTNPFEGMPIRPKGKETRLWIDNEYFEKGYAAIFPKSVTSVYCVLARHANAETQTCFPSASKIMERTGIKNRRTAFDAIRILEAFDIIAVVHSNGRVPNHYAMLDASVWKPANRGMVDTVRQARKKKTTVAVNPPQPSQTELPNSGTGETRNHITESDNKISRDSKISIKGKQLIERLSQLTASVVIPYFREDDIVGALEEIYASGGFEDTTPSHRVIHEALLRRGAVPTQELPSWLKSRGS